MAMSGVCRICLSETVEKDITQLTEELEEPQKSYWDIMLFCFNIQILPESKLTTKLCMKCFMNIISFHKFKTLALKSEAYLQYLLNQENNKYGIIEVNMKDEKPINRNSDYALCEMERVKLEIKLEDDLGHNDDTMESDDELLSVIKKIKYEFSVPEESKENAVAPRKTKIKKSMVRNRSRKWEKSEKICEECGKTVINLKDHMAVHMPAGNRIRYKCKVCDKTFASYSARYRHHKVKHLGIKQHCEECGKDVVSLKSHRLLMHNNQNLPFECVSCDRRFISQAKVDSHMLTHTKDRPFQCEQCDKRYKSKLGLTQHIRQVHDQEKSHLCQICSKRFFKKYHLQMHLRSHTKEKPHKCPDCGKHFSTTTILNNHRMIHSEVRGYACDRCDMTFKKPGYLRNHMISHTKEKRFSCKYCGWLFGRSDHRSRHERTAHERHLVAAAS